MRRRVMIALVAVVVLASAAGVAAFTSRGEDAEPVYTVAQVNRGLAQNPAGWLGRIVRVRGKALIPMNRAGPVCCSGLLADPAAPAQRIRLVWRAVSPLLTLALRLPVLKAVAAPRVGGAGVYRVLLTRATGIVPAPGLPGYFPYSGKTVAVNYDEAALVGDLN